MAATLPPPKGGSGAGGGGTDYWSLGDWGNRTVDSKGIFTFDNDMPSGTFEPRHGSQGYYHTLNDVMDRFATNGDKSITASIQQALYLGGYYSDKKYIPTLGVLHDQDFEAFRDAIKFAASGGTSLSQLLNESALAGAQQGTRQQHNYEQLTHTIRTTDPNEVGLNMEAAFEDALGRKPTDTEKARFVASFRTKEIGAQQSVFSAEDAARQAYINRETGGQDFAGGVSQTVTAQAPNATADALMEARTRYPDEYGAHNIAKSGADFFAMLRGH